MAHTDKTMRAVLNDLTEQIKARDGHRLLSITIDYGFVLFNKCDNDEERSLIIEWLFCLFDSDSLRDRGTLRLYMVMEFVGLRKQLTRVQKKRLNTLRKKHRESMERCLAAKERITKRKQRRRERYQAKKK